MVDTAEPGRKNVHLCLSRSAMFRFMPSQPTVTELVKLYQLQPHPEGGFFKESYRAQGMIEVLPAPFTGPRSYSTAIYFLLPRGTKSRLHRIAADETWHFYLGGPLSVVQIFPG